ncbi:unnamed protein product [Didymodactylos carnosus]|uniref:Uncharacterized protein n=1 Tax=Didymodactylos carnosus TaxID=1234261 RepID=A0A814NNQ3_9BILA|nr:unnamed protein product [Didymodactylos carnosus]CAF3861523.1 unnamed protein product [Didymodactylos carnosus]
MGSHPSKEISKKDSSIIVKYDEKNLEDFVVVWHDSKMYSTPEYAEIEALLQPFVHYIKTFDKIDECFTYITTYLSEKIFLICTAEIGFHLVPQVMDLDQVKIIYLYRSSSSPSLASNRYEVWIKRYKKIRQIFNDKLQMIDTFKQDVRHYKNDDGMPFKLLSKSVTEKHSISDLEKKDLMFLFFQVFNEMLLDTSHRMIDKIEGLNDYKHYYTNNETEQILIKKFNRKYQSDEALQWYIHDNCFLQRILTKAFRSENFDQIFKLQYFITDLHQQLRNIQVHQQKIAIVYRQQRMSSDEIQNLQDNVGGYISSKSFFLTSEEKMHELVQDGLESVLIHIIPNPKYHTFANIDKYRSSSQEEHQVMFTVGSLFRIESVEKLNDVWMVKLLFNDSDEKKMTKLLNKFKKQIDEKPNLIKLDCAQHFHLALIQLPPSNVLDVADLQNNLGLIYKDQGEYKLANRHLAIAVEMYCRTVHHNHIVLAPTYDNIGNVYRCTEDYKQALINQEKALQIRLKSLPSNHNDIVKSYGNIGLTYKQKGDFQTSLKYYQNALQVCLKASTPNRKNIGRCYHNIGYVYMDLKEWSFALTNLEKALNYYPDIPSNHVRIDACKKLIETVKKLV